jgi:hypothetical protein
MKTRRDFPSGDLSLGGGDFSSLLAKLDEDLMDVTTERG